MITMLTSAGGGFGDPFERDPDLVAADVRDGRVSPEAARRGLWGGNRPRDRGGGPGGHRGSEKPMTLALGIDIGGTFTDVVMIDRSDDSICTAKVLTTPDDPAAGVLDGIAELLAEAGHDPPEVSQVVHATTLATNLILERKGGPVAYVTTAGFGDILIIGNERKGDAEKYGPLLHQAGAHRPPTAHGGCGRADRG